MEDRVDVNVEIENQGKNALWFYSEFSWGSAGYVDFEVYRFNGDRVPNLIAVDDWTIEASREPSTDKLVRLEPGQVITTRRKFCVNELVDGPGRYRIVVRYHSRAPWLTFEGVPVWGRDMGFIVGSTWFEVRNEQGTKCASSRESRFAT
jgi:hypothetical protein